MRRVAVLALVVLAVSAGPALSAPQSVSIALFEFKPATVTVNAGEAVTWRFSGPDTNHSVTSNPPGQAEAFDSDPGRFPDSSDHPVGDTFVHTFTKPGRYTYFCKVHPSMEGTVVVNNADGTAPADTTNPRITRLRVDRPGTTARFTLSEAARLDVRWLKGRKLIRRRTPTGRKGANTVKLGRTLRAGRYRITVKATDLSPSRNFSTASLRFTVR